MFLKSHELNEVKEALPGLAIVSLIRLWDALTRRPFFGTAAD
jgi:hypothetical protein